MVTLGGAPIPATYAFEGLSTETSTTLDLVLFARFKFQRISRGQIREFKNCAKIIITIALLKKNTN